jgi:chaperonin GroEL (HSP60 family)
MYDYEWLRVAKLSSGVAIIKVGVTTEPELEDWQLQIQNAENSTFAAIQEGIVLGSGLTYVHLSIYVPAIKETIEDHDGCLDADIILKVTCLISIC